MAKSSRSIRAIRRWRSRRTAGRILSSPRSECAMTQKLLAIVTGALLIGLAAPVSAANKEHQQLMADIRMLQEQTQLLQNLLGQFNEALKAVNSRLDQQTETNRKMAADQKLAIDNLANDARVIREKLDDNNVRVGSLTQEVDALRQSMQQLATRPAAGTDALDPSTAGGAGVMPPPGAQPSRAGAPSP